jgi:hypothetical protein
LRQLTLVCLSLVCLALQRLRAQLPESRQSDRRSGHHQGPPAIEKRFHVSTPCCKGVIHDRARFVELAIERRIAEQLDTAAHHRGNTARLKKCGAYCGEKREVRKGHFSCDVRSGALAINGCRVRRIARKLTLRGMNDGHRLTRARTCESNLRRAARQRLRRPKMAGNDSPSVILSKVLHFVGRLSAPTIHRQALPLLEIDP